MNNGGKKLDWHRPSPTFLVSYRERVVPRDFAGIPLTERCKARCSSERCDLVDGHEGNHAALRDHARRCAVWRA